MRESKQTVEMLEIDRTDFHIPTVTTTATG